jgi:hypothetical protein
LGAKEIGSVMLGGLKRLWRPPAVATRMALAEFLERHAAMITNRSIIGYCHVKTRLPLHELTREARFAEAFERGRSESYAAVLADLVIVAEGVLRGPTAPSLAAGFTTLYAEMLARQGVPAHRPDGWAVAVDELRTRLQMAQQGPPRRVADIAERSAARICAEMPIHESLRAQDEPAIKANVQFLIVGLYHEFETRLDHGALVRALAG